MKSKQMSDITNAATSVGSTIELKTRATSGVLGDLDALTLVRNLSRGLSASDIVWFPCRSPDPTVGREQPVIRLSKLRPYLDNDSVSSRQLGPPLISKHVSPS